ncbi:xylose isomerase [Mangrovactinospora gilvigrisea]|uniref:Xylose isomerase n=1 Tax=Mangrovactinospora gilvigrisea TaxID=1428644 RepID=A0A1J7BCC4_9ACTN|nr:sugar phosphate isomerase/epimerase family protein [Mangrovactinospora gilvigrisea]OIV36294.1 xylose isomerase [Mangrovactinospora gilvigrisea]
MWTLSGFADEISPDLDEQCAVLRRLGMDHLEFRAAWDTNVLDLDDAGLARVRETLDRAGLRTSSIGSPIGKIGIADDFDAHLVRFDRALHTAKVLEAPFIRIFSFWIPDGDDPADHRDEVLRRMSALAERARGHDVVLLHENEKKIYGDTPGRCLDLIESVGSEQLKVAWDSANFVQCGVRPFTDGYAMLRPHLAYVQIKDAVAATGGVVPAGEGDGELRETVEALRGDGFDGFFSLEPHLAAAGPLGGFSGAQLFETAHGAFTGLLKERQIPFA